MAHRLDKAPHPRGRRRTPLRVLSRVLLLLGACVVLWVWLVWPPPAWYVWAWPQSTSFMSLRRSEEHAAIDRGERRGPPPQRLYQPVPMARVSAVMREAVLVAEDHRFYEHNGIDYVEFRHALGYRPDDFEWGSGRHRAELWRALRKLSTGAVQMRGASTITQQLAKNLYLSPSRNPFRKVKEAVTAWRLEYWLGKHRILELYLNVVELGPEVWGVEAASRKYFGHSARTLSLEEAAALAGTLPFPLRSNPGFRPGRMVWRKQMIVRRIRGEKFEIPADTPDSIPDQE